MPQQYIVGEFSLLLADLPLSPGEGRARLDQLRREVERSSPARLPPLAQEAFDLTDMLCWAALERGDLSGFCCYATTADALREFTTTAGLR
jgi:hypothetical protein